MKMMKCLLLTNVNNYLKSDPSKFFALISKGKLKIHLKSFAMIINKISKV